MNSDIWSPLCFFAHSFSEFFKQLCDMDTTGKHPRPKELKFARNLLIPKRGSVFDYVYTRKTFGAWNQWATFVTATEIADNTQVCRLERYWDTVKPVLVATCL